MKSLKIRINFLIINPIIRTVYYKRFAESSVTSSSRKAASQVFHAFSFSSSPSSPKRVDEIPDARADNRSRLRNPRITAHGNDIPIRLQLYWAAIIAIIRFYFFRPPTRMDHAATFARRLYKFNGIPRKWDIFLFLKI